MKIIYVKGVLKMYLHIKGNFSGYTVSTSSKSVYKYSFIYDLCDPSLWIYEYLNEEDISNPDYADFVLKSAHEHMLDVLESYKIDNQTSAGAAGTQSNAGELDDEESCPLNNY